MKLPDNPILKRLIRTHSPPARHFMTISLLIFLALNSWFLILSYGHILDSFLRTIPYFACPAVVFCLFIFAVSSTSIVTQESQGETFQLMRLTNIPASRVAWGYVGGIMFRVRRYIVLFAFALPMSVLPMFLAVREGDNSVAAESVLDDPNVLEVMSLFSMGILLSFCSVFLIVSSSVTRAFQSRRPIRAALTVLFDKGLLYIGLVGLFVLVISTGTTDTTSILFGLALTILPYAIALWFAFVWRIDARTIAPILNTIPLSITIITGLGFEDVVEIIPDPIPFVFSILFSLLGILLVISIFMNPDSPKVPVRIGYITWQVTIACILLVRMGSDYVAFRDVSVSVIMINLWLIQVAVGFQTLKRSTKYLWYERFY